MYVQLLNSVSASIEGFERTQFSTAQVRQWLADRFPDSIEYDLPEVEPGEEVDPEELADIRLRLRSGARMPGEEELRATLGMEPNESLDASNPEVLVPLARRQIARQRQQMLATMVMMGMQRIVIDSGRINASMRFHIDTRSAATEDRSSEFGLQNRVRASGRFGMGPWGASAEVENSITYVTTQRSQNTEEINTDLELNSAVELNFRTDYLPLNRMAAQAQAERIRNATLNPASETGDAEANRARQARLEAQLGAERERRSSRVRTAPAPTPAPSPAPRPSPGPAPAPRQSPTSAPSPGPTAARSPATSPSPARSPARSPATASSPSPAPSPPTSSSPPP